ncbi:MAG: efflux RND transporter permease subunit [Candidatus Omnitrophota bacterium]
MNQKLHSSDWIGKVVTSFAQSKLTILIISASLLLGLFSVVNLPREEEPQISVPIFDVFVSYAGASSEDVERRIVNLGERKLWEIPGVEYIYSTAEPEGAFFVVRFKVGSNVEESLIKLYTKVYSNLDVLPKGASQPLIKLRSIDDVPVMALTFYGENQSPMELRRAAARVQTLVNAIPDVSETALIGGQKRQFSVFFDEAKLNERLISRVDIVQLIRERNIKASAGHLEGKDRILQVETDSFFRSKKDLENLVVGQSLGQILYLKDIARVEDGPDDQEQSASIRFPKTKPGKVYPAATLSISKRKGTNASKLNETILERIEQWKGGAIPDGVEVCVTRDYGETATEKSNELLLHMLIAIAGVSLLIALVLGRWESGVVAVAIPMTLALTLATFYFFGFTLNRITLFALIFSIGILVDDPIVDVENIVRHMRMPSNQGRPLLAVTIEAVNEVRSPLILATLTVIVAILPMAFVRGLMGPYMRPIPVGSTAAMIFSMAVAFVATPWTAHQILRRAKPDQKAHLKEQREDFLTRLYRSYMKPLIYQKRVRYLFLIFILALLGLSVLLIPLKAVRVKMLPFDNKNEFQVILDMPEGASYQKTSEVIDQIAAALEAVPEVTNIETYVGTSAPYNFNGLVRHYFLRNKPTQADLQVNLLKKGQRHRQSHDIAKSVRPMIHQIVAAVPGAGNHSGPIYEHRCRIRLGSGFAFAGRKGRAQLFLAAFAAGLVGADKPEELAR